jgi:hypothetical protein
MNKPIISLVLALASTPALSREAAAPVIDKLENCAELQDTRQRLACFDREFAPFRTQKAAPAQPTAPSPAAAPVSPPPRPAPESSGPVSFGQESLPAKERPSVTEEAQALHARITSLREVDPDTSLATLDNGQVWRYEKRYLATSLREGEAVTIRKAALGAYRLTRDDSDAKNWIRTSRVR